VDHKSLQLTVWLPTTKSRESTRFWGVQIECDTPLESSWGELQNCFRPHPNSRFESGVMSSQSPKSLNRNSFETPLWESWENKPFGCGCGGVTQRILYGGRWWPPLIPGRGESNESVLPVACPNTKGVSEGELTLLWLVLITGPSN